MRDFKFSQLFLISLVFLFPITARASNDKSLKPSATPIFELRDMVQSIAFDPDSFFVQEEDYDLPELTMFYKGDDYDWPVYALALKQGCFHKETWSLYEDCREQWTALIVRAPELQYEHRPRDRGVELLDNIGKLYDDDNRISIENAITQSKIEWLEADVDQCEGAIKALRELITSDWVDPEFADDWVDPEFADNDNDIIHIVIHADTIDLTIRPSYLQEVRYSGWLKKDSAAWVANNFVKKLEPCWEPAKSNPPWQRIESE